MSKCAQCESTLGVYEYNRLNGEIVCDSCFNGFDCSEDAVPGLYEKNSTAVKKIFIVFAIWIFYRLLYLIPSISSDEVSAFWDTLRYGDTLLQKLDFFLTTRKTSSIMVLGGNPYYLSILYFFFFSKFIPPLKRMIQDETKQVRVRNIILGFTLFTICLQSYFISALSLSTWNISLAAFNLQFFLIILGSIAAIGIFIGVTKIIGFPGVLLFVLLDFILIRVVHYAATYKMIENTAPELPPMKIVHIVVAGISFWMWLKEYRESWGRFAKIL